MSGSAVPIKVEKVIQAETGRVWQALTTHTEMVQWFFEEIPSFEPVVGFETEFVIELPPRVFTHEWEILEAEPGKRIVYRWSYREYPGVGRVAFSVDEVEAGTRVEVINGGIETFPQEVPEFSRENAFNGWTYFLDRLASHVEAV